MEIIFYILIFIIGSLFGSFYTLAIYRIPKKQDITHTHSYCPNCNHKLGLLDLIPIFSYIFLLGKCRYCKEKIRPRYLIIEILSGVLFLLIAYLTNFNLETLSTSTIIQYSFMVLYITFIILMAGIDKEKIIHEKDEIEATSHLKIEGIDKVFILHDLYSIEETKRIKAKVKEIIDNK